MKPDRGAMATYVISDIHGRYYMLMDLPEKVSFQDSDLLFALLYISVVAFKLPVIVE